MRRLALSLAALSLVAAPALAQDEFARTVQAPPAVAAPAKPGKPAKRVQATPPIQTRVSAQAAATYLAQYVCLPQFFGEGGPEELAPYHEMHSADPVAAGGHQGEQAWYLASTTKVYVLKFANGSCGISLGNSAGGDFKAAMLDTFKAMPKEFKPGATKTDTTYHLTTTTYCTEGDKPVVARVTLPMLGFHTAHKLEAVFSQPATAPADCSA